MNRQDRLRELANRRAETYVAKRRAEIDRTPDVAELTTKYLDIRDEIDRLLKEEGEE